MGMARRFQVLQALGMSRLVVSAGMPRSGSTLLFNVVRQCLEYKYGDSVVSGWINDIHNISKGSIYLLKVHDIDRMLYYRSIFYFYSFRDVRDALVSANRKFGQEPTIEMCRYYVKGYKRAKRYANSMFKYEEFTVDIDRAVTQIKNILEVDVSNVDIITGLPDVGSNDRSGEVVYDRKTLMHGSHGTSTKTGDWRTSLSEPLLAEISNEFEWWFKENNYELS